MTPAERSLLLAIAQRLLYGDMPSGERIAMLALIDRVQREQKGEEAGSDGR